jgi:hypothetical protein
MKRESQRLAGILLIVLPTVMYGGLTILTMLIRDPQYVANPLRQDLWRAGHAHAGVLLVLSLVVLRYVDDANLSGRLQALVRMHVHSAGGDSDAGRLLLVDDQPRSRRGVTADRPDISRRLRARGRCAHAGCRLGSATTRMKPV